MTLQSLVAQRRSKTCWYVNETCRKGCLYPSRIIYVSHCASSSTLAAAPPPHARTLQAESHLSIAALACHFQEHPSFALWALHAYRPPPFELSLSTARRNLYFRLSRHGALGASTLLTGWTICESPENKEPAISPQQPKPSIPQRRDNA